MATSPNETADPKRKQNHPFALTTLTSLFFIWGFITALNDILIPHLKNVFSLNYTQAMLVQFCFFGAYFLISIPAGSLVSRVGYKRGLVTGLIIAGLGCMLFIPAASMRLYPLFLGALFILASGVTILQVSANPFVTALGPAATASSRLTLTQGFNALGTTVAPFFGALLILGAAPEIATTDNVAMLKKAEAETVKLPYMLIAFTLMALAVILARIQLPTVHRDTPTAKPATAPITSLWQFRHLILGTVGIFVYVGAEVAIGSLLINFMGELNLGMSEQAAAKYVALYWGGAMVGRFLGAWIMTRIQPGHCLAFNAVCATLLIITAVLTQGQVAMYAILLVGLCNSIMFPTIFSLAVHGLGSHTSRGSGILCAAIVGGALIPVAQGALADWIGLHASFLLPALCYLYITHYGLAGSKVLKSNEPGDVCA